jgi:hypothetical protein
MGKSVSGQVYIFSNFFLFATVMDCMFNKSDRKKDAELDTGMYFLHSFPAKSDVYNTALGCVGMGFQLGHGGLDIDTDSFMHTRNTTERTKTKVQLNARTFSNAYFGSGGIYPSTREFETNTNILSNKNKSSIEHRSPIHNVFYYHYNNVQRVNPMVTGIHFNVDTRMELRKALHK